MSVSKPNDSIAGMKHFTLYNGVPAIATSEVTCPLRLANTCSVQYKWISAFADTTCPPFLEHGRYPELMETVPCK